MSIDYQQNRLCVTWMCIWAWISFMPKWAKKENSEKKFFYAINYYFPLEWAMKCNPLCFFFPIHPCSLTCSSFCTYKCVLIPAIKLNKFRALWAINNITLLPSITPNTYLLWTLNSLMMMMAHVEPNFFLFLYFCLYKMMEHIFLGSMIFSVVFVPQPSPSFLVTSLFMTKELFGKWDY